MSPGHRMDPERTTSPGPPSRPASRFLSALGVAAALAAVAAGGCSPNRGADDLIADPFEDALVLDAVLTVDAAFPDILFTRTIGPLEDFTEETIGVRNATIRITSRDGQVVDYAEFPGSPGRYAPQGGSGTVLPGTTYDIDARTSDGRVVTGTTRTPPRFDIERWLLLDETATTEVRQFGTFDSLGAAIYDDPRNQVEYLAGLLEARFEEQDVLAFQVAVVNLEEDSPLVVDPDFFEEEDFADLERVLSSPPLSGENGTLRLPWLAIYFEGRTLIRIYSVDENWFDLVRSTPGLDQGGGGIAFGGNAGEDFERPLFRLNGGIGLFGSAAVDSVGFRVLPPD